MPQAAELTHLKHTHGALPLGQAPLCLLLVHNELNILSDFFKHYRRFGPLQFVVIDDRSTDGSREFLEAQPDVCLFTPMAGSSYAAHKRVWRSELLDHFGCGRWCLVPDADEHLVWKDWETRSFDALIADLEAECAEGMAATMVDMYADKPIAEHVSRGSRLVEEFPLFDDPLLDDLAYRRRLLPSRFIKKFGTPEVETTGGMRDRIFFDGYKAHTTLGKFLLRSSYKKPYSARGVVYLRERVIYHFSGLPKSLRKLSLTKLPLLKWRIGGKFNGGAHRLSLPITLSAEECVLMHFPITRGMDGIRYLAQRGQHAEKSRYYLAMEDFGEINPVYYGSSQYDGSNSFRGFFE